jgi:rhodanese-related sulfurtransferase
MNSKLRRLGFCLMLFACGAISTPEANAQLAEFFGGGPEIEEIQTQELANMLRDQKATDQAAADGTSPPRSFVLVDVRSDEEVNVSVIPGAITKADYEKEPNKYSGQLVIPYCTVGGRSGAYSKQLVAKGIKVKNYKGSILEWVAAELPLVTLEGKPTNRVHTVSDRYRVPKNYEQVTP